MERRNFLQTACFACLGLSALPAVLQSCSTGRYVTAVLQDRQLVVKKTDFAIIKKDKTVNRPFVLVKHEQLQFPVSVYRFETNEYRALYMQCTHQGCELNAYTTQLVCPCHGSEFTNTGKVLQGPAEADLLEFSVTNDGEHIYIQLP